MWITLNGSTTRMDMASATASSPSLPRRSGLRRSPRPGVPMRRRRVRHGVPRHGTRGGNANGRTAAAGCRERSMCRNRRRTTTECSMQPRCPDTRWRIIRRCRCPDASRRRGALRSQGCGPKLRSSPWPARFTGVREPTSQASLPLPLVMLRRCRCRNSVARRHTRSPVRVGDCMSGTSPIRQAKMIYESCSGSSELSCQSVSQATWRPADREGLLSSRWLKTTPRYRRSRT